MASATKSTDLLDPEFIGRLERLDIVSRRIFAGRMKGERRSKRKGQSVEFADYRNYVVGDDLRFLDWNIYARLERPFPVYGRREPEAFETWYSESPDGRFWGNTRLVLKYDDVPFCNRKNGPAGQPIKTDKGWLTIFHAGRATARTRGHCRNEGRQRFVFSLTSPPMPQGSAGGGLIGTGFRPTR